MPVAMPRLGTLDDLGAIGQGRGGLSQGTEPRIAQTIPMRLHELAERIGAKVLTPGEVPGVEIHWACAGDTISHLLADASDTTLMVTHLAGGVLVRAARLVDASAICLTNGVVPAPELVRAAAASGTVLMASPVGMFETCGRLYQCLHHDSQEGA